MAEGREALLVAYHRDSVEALNQAAREAWEKLGKLSGPELEAPGGRRYRAGDRVITLAPGPGGAWVTSQRAVVTSVDPGRSLSLLSRLKVPCCTWAPTRSGATNLRTPTPSPPTARKVPPWTSPTRSKTGEDASWPTWP